MSRVRARGEKREEGSVKREAGAHRVTPASRFTLHASRLLGELSEMFKEAGKDPLGHPPDHRVIEPVGRELTALASDLELDRVIGVRMEQEIQRDPARGGDLGVEPELGP